MGTNSGDKRLEGFDHKHAEHKRKRAEREHEHAEREHKWRHKWELNKQEYQDKHQWRSQSLDFSDSSESEQMSICGDGSLVPSSSDNRHSISPPNIPQPNFARNRENVTVSFTPELHALSNNMNLVNREEAETGSAFLSSQAIRAPTWPMASSDSAIPVDARAITMTEHNPLPFPVAQNQETEEDKNEAPIQPIVTPNIKVDKVGSGDGRRRETRVESESVVAEPKNDRLSLSVRTKAVYTKVKRRLSPARWSRMVYL